MKRNTFLRHWPVTLALAGIALIAILALGSTPVQAFQKAQSQSLQATPPAPTVPAATVPVATVIVPNTGGSNTFIVNFFSNWAIWAVLGVLVIVVLVALIARPRGTDIDRPL